MLLEKERHLQTVDFQKHVVCIDTVEDVVVKMERHFPLYTMSTSQAAYLEYIFLLDHW